MQVKYDRKLLIAIGRSRKAAQWQNKELLWSEFLDKLANTTRTRETVNDYAAMTKAERAKPELLNGSRRARIAKGAGVTVTDVNQMMKKFNETKKMVKQATAGMEQQASRKGKKGKKGKRRRGLGIPGMGGMSMSDLKKIQDMMGQ